MRATRWINSLWGGWLPFVVHTELISENRCNYAWVGVGEGVEDEFNNYVTYCLFLGPNRYGTTAGYSEGRDFQRFPRRSVVLLMTLLTYLARWRAINEGEIIENVI